MKITNDTRKETSDAHKETSDARKRTSDKGRKRGKHGRHGENKGLSTFKFVQSPHAASVSANPVYLVENVSSTLQNPIVDVSHVADSKGKHKLKEKDQSSDDDEMNLAKFCRTDEDVQELLQSREAGPSSHNSNQIKSVPQEMDEKEVEIWYRLMDMDGNYLDKNVAMIKIFLSETVFHLIEKVLDKSYPGKSKQYYEVTEAYAPRPEEWDVSNRNDLESDPDYVVYKTQATKSLPNGRPLMKFPEMGRSGGYFFIIKGPLAKLETLSLIETVQQTSSPRIEDDAPALKNQFKLFFDSETTFSQKANIMDAIWGRVETSALSYEPFPLVKNFHVKLLKDRDASLQRLYRLLTMHIAMRDNVPKNCKFDRDYNPVCSLHGSPGTGKSAFLDLVSHLEFCLALNYDDMNWDDVQNKVKIKLKKQ